MQTSTAWRLAPAIHAAVDCGNLVLLDERRDAYYCLPGAGEGRRQGPLASLDGLSGELLEELQSEGLALQDGGATADLPLVAAPTENLRLSELPRVGIADCAAVASAGLRLAPHFHRKPLAAVLAHARDRRARLDPRRDGDSEGLRDRAARFMALLPWSPVQGACLLQAALMLEYLAADGLVADWVFGVRTWPFSAHCWLRAYDYVTDRGGLALSDYARSADPFAKVGQVQVAVDVSSVIRASPSSFRVAWTERRYVDGALASTERWTAILGVAIQQPRTPDQLRRNPLGVFVHALDWSKELG